LEEQVFVKSKKTLISSVEGINKNWKKHALSGNAVKDFIRCFPAKGPSVRIAWAISPGQSVSRVSKPQSGRPFDEHRIELSARWACVNDQSTVTKADGPGYLERMAHWAGIAESRFVVVSSLLQSSQSYDQKSFTALPDGMPADSECCRAAAPRGACFFLLLLIPTLSHGVLHAAAIQTIAASVNYFRSNVNSSLPGATVAFRSVLVRSVYLEGISRFKVGGVTPGAGRISDSTGVMVT